MTGVIVNNIGCPLYGFPGPAEVPDGEVERKRPERIALRPNATMTGLLRFWLHRSRN